MNWIKDLPNSFWAFMFIVVACTVAVISLFVKDKTDTTAVITMASSIITGAFGYIQGQKDAKSSLTVPQTPGTATTVSVNTPSPQQGNTP